MKTASFIFNSASNSDLEKLSVETQRKIEIDRESADRMLLAIEQDHVENREQRIKEEVRKILLIPKPENNLGWENKPKWTKPRPMEAIRAQAETIVDKDFDERRGQHIRSARENEEVTIRKELPIIEPVRDPKDIKYPDLK